MPDTSVITEIMNLKNASLDEIKAKYAELFDQGDPSSNNKIFLWRKIAYRMQENHYGKLPEATQGRINELIQRYDPVNNKSLRPDDPEPGKRNATARDRRLPIPGAVIKKEYKGLVYNVKVLEKGFEYNGKIYNTLSAVATAITGVHWNGYLFFNP